MEYFNMICPRCEVEMEPFHGRLTCPECGYNEPPRKVVVPDTGDDDEAVRPPTRPTV